MKKTIISLFFMLFSSNLQASYFCGQGEETFRAVDLDTILGPIRIALFDKQAPRTTENFAYYVSQGFYDNTVVHQVERRMAIHAGLYSADYSRKAALLPPLHNETNAIKHQPMRVAMWRDENPDTATSAFFINLGENSTLDIPHGYTVFGEVIRGKDRVKRMQYKFLCQNIEKNHSDCRPVIIHSAKLVMISCDAKTKAAS